MKKRYVWIVYALFIGLALAALMLVDAASPSDALAVTGACSTSAARAEVRAAVRAHARVEHRLAEARRVAAATALYSQRYGGSVGRWVRAARRAGWQWSDMGTLMLVVYTESKGDPSALNGIYAGLLQFGEPWWLGKWDPFNGPVNLHHGESAHNANGWSPWPWLGR